MIDEGRSGPAYGRTGEGQATCERRRCGMCMTGSACRSPGDWDAANRLQPCRRRHSEGFLIGKLVQTGFGFLLYPPVTLTGRRNYQRSGVGCNWVPSDRCLWRRGARQENLRMEEFDPAGGCRVQDIKYWNAQEKKHKEEEAAKGQRRRRESKANAADEGTA